MKEKDNFEMIVSLRKISTGNRPKRYERALKYIRNVIMRHFNAEKVILDPLIAEAISTNKRDKIVRKIRVVANKIDEKTYLVKLAINSE